MKSTRTVLDVTLAPGFRDYDVETALVARMHRKFGLGVSDEPGMLTKELEKERLECLQEELDELRRAFEQGDFAEQADALVDLVVFAKGTAVLMGLPWAELFDDVMQSNLAKVRGVGHRGHKVDLVKPAGWRGPQGRVILEEHGWDPSSSRRRSRDDL